MPDFFYNANSGLEIVVTKSGMSYGLTTMKDRHVTIDGSGIRFCFKGKKGIEHTISLTSRKLANVVRACRDIPGKELFQYYTKDR